MNSFSAKRRQTIFDLAFQENHSCKQVKVLAAASNQSISRGAAPTCSINANWISLTCSRIKNEKFMNLAKIPTS